MGKPHPLPNLSEQALAKFHRFYQEGNPSECWEWRGRQNGRGYGVCSFGGRTYRANRLSYQIANGPFPIEGFVCHSCDNRLCVNPAHLWIGTALQNTQDMLAKGRKKTPPQCKPIPIRAYKNTASPIVARSILLLDYVEARAAQGCSEAARLCAIANAELAA